MMQPYLHPLSQYPAYLNQQIQPPHAYHLNGGQALPLQVYATRLLQSVQTAPQPQPYLPFFSQFADGTGPFARNTAEASGHLEGTRANIEHKPEAAAPVKREDPTADIREQMRQFADQLKGDQQQAGGVRSRSVSPEPQLREVPQVVWNTPPQSLDQEQVHALMARSRRIRQLAAMMTERSAQQNSPEVVNGADPMTHHDLLDKYGIGIRSQRSAPTARSQQAPERRPVVTVPQGVSQSDAEAAEAMAMLSSATITSNPAAPAPNTTPTVSEHDWTTGDCAQFRWLVRSARQQLPGRKVTQKRLLKQVEQLAIRGSLHHLTCERMAEHVKLSRRGGVTSTKCPYSSPQASCREVMRHILYS